MSSENGVLLRISDLESNIMRFGRKRRKVFLKIYCMEKWSGVERKFRILEKILKNRLYN